MKKIITILFPFVVLLSFFVFDNVTSLAANINSTNNLTKVTEEKAQVGYITPNPRTTTYTYTLNGNYCFLRHVEDFDYDWSGVTGGGVLHLQKVSFDLVFLKNHNPSATRDGFTINVGNWGNYGGNSSLYAETDFIIVYSAINPRNDWYEKHLTNYNFGSPCFSTPEQCYSYLTLGVEDGAVDPESGSVSLSQEFDSSIPLPVCDFTTNENGAYRNLIFHNSVYQLNKIYGLIVTGSWCSVDDISLTFYDTVGTSSRYSITYTELLSDTNLLFDLGYSLPSNESEIKKCPYTLSFSDQDSFNTFLDSFPVSERNITSNASPITNAFRSSLSDVDSGYNFAAVSVQYYYVDDNYKVHYGNPTTLVMPYLGQGEIITVNKQTGEIGTPSPSGPGGGIGSSDVDSSSLISSYKSLLGMVGEFPQFISQLFAFLPEWVIILISVCIGFLLVLGLIRIVTG